MITYDDFAKLDLRVGRILKADRVPETDKLIHLTVDLGEDAPRSIVSGIAEFFSAEDLIHQQVVIVANLEPRILKGIESQGMILATRSEGGLFLLAPGGDVLPGSKVN
jgi:methionyl-tRNA synthetase